MTSLTSGRDQLGRASLRARGSRQAPASRSPRSRQASPGQPDAGLGGLSRVRRAPRSHSIVRLAAVCGTCSLTWPGSRPGETTTAGVGLLASRSCNTQVQHMGEAAQGAGAGRGLGWDGRQLTWRRFVVLLLVKLWDCFQHDTLEKAQCSGFGGGARLHSAGDGPMARNRSAV